LGKENYYGHPHPETFAVLNKYDITILRTDKRGDIKIVTDGKNLKIINERDSISNF
jgi:competence protein ComEC